MRIVAIGDIGVVDDMIHLGDEAMFEECVTQLRHRGVAHVTAVSANPDDTRGRYGVDAVARSGFERPSAEVVNAVRASDAVVITGGGNLSSLWPIHIAERRAMAALATEFRKPLIVTGQTLGPWLDPRGTELVRELLAAATLVGVRERASLDLARSLGVPVGRLQLNPDDASFLGATEESAARRTALSSAGEDSGSGGDAPYCLVTLAAHVGDAEPDAVIAAAAALLDEVVAVTGLGIRFLAHYGALQSAHDSAESASAGPARGGPGVAAPPLPVPARGDSVMHERVAAAMTAPWSTAATTDARAAATLARGARLVVSSRYHPVVFAVAAGVPSIGVSVDDYTTVKLRGALTAFGQTGPLSAEALVAGDGIAALRRVWTSREETRSRGLALAARRRSEATAWWDRVAAAIG